MILRDQEQGDPGLTTKRETLPIETKRNGTERNGPKPPEGGQGRLPLKMAAGGEPVLPHLDGFTGVGRKQEIKFVL